MLLPSRPARSFTFHWVAAALILIAGIAVSAYVYVQVDRTSRQDIIDRAATLAQALSADDIASLSGSSTDLNAPAYQRLKALLMHERAVNHGIKFIYLIGQNPDRTLFFYGDSEDPASPDYSPPGQEYPEATPAMHQFFSDAGKSLSEGPDRDRWGLWVSAYAPVRDADGKLVAMLGMDVPAQGYLSDLIAYASLPLLLTALLLILLLVDSLRHAREEQLLAQKAEFLSIASHQIRTPLIGIRWAVEQVLSSAQSLSERERNTLSLTHDSALNLISHVNTLLDATSLEQRGPHMPNQSVLMKPLFEEIIGNLALSAKRKDVRITLDDTIPSELELVGDRQTLQHVFFNLIGNAVKYTKQGSGIGIAYEWTPEGHRFSIRDHGIGIAPGDQSLIFAGYHRTQQAMESGEAGSGLGLYLTKRLVELLHGSISVQSKVGEGSTFIVTLRG